jgi:RNA polymerase-binding transcription factor DksA
MSRSEQMGKIRERLLKKRDEVFEAHRLSDEARLVLSEHDIEPEDTAQKENIANVLTILDEMEQKEIQDINRALARIEFGEFGACEVCGKEIEAERLETIPQDICLQQTCKNRMKGPSGATQCCGLLQETRPAFGLERLSGGPFFIHSTCQSRACSYAHARNPHRPWLPHGYYSCTKDYPQD